MCQRRWRCCVVQHPVRIQTPAGDIERCRSTKRYEKKTAFMWPLRSHRLRLTLHRTGRIHCDSLFALRAAAQARLPQAMPAGASELKSQCVYEMYRRGGGTVTVFVSRHSEARWIACVHEPFASPCSHPGDSKHVDHLLLSCVWFIKARGSTICLPHSIRTAAHAPTQACFCAASFTHATPSSPACFDGKHSRLTEAPTSVTACERLKVAACTCGHLRQFPLGNPCCSKSAASLSTVGSCVSLLTESTSYPTIISATGVHASARTCHGPERRRAPWHIELSSMTCMTECCCVRDVIRGCC